MRFNKHMIDLLREIRRRVPSHQKPAIKLANPELISELYDAFEQSRDSICKVLIREFIEQNRSLDDPLYDVNASGKMVFDQLQKTNKNKDDRPKRVYRGQIIEA
ncbi:hypothetical protein [uncultured Pseudoteredinibacter sp.]|uniref:hypothetical protein n=1 Tax=uncultured Pseudoteredinibacter sp. TaxID=1641701 RepID=UPI0026351F4E|nr:hypothetical protein [uncultured Pseudoteredinibacter sp.]